MENSLKIRVSNFATSLKWHTVAMPLLETRERQERERLERDGAMADGLHT